MKAKASPDEVVDVEVTFVPQNPGPLSTTLDIQVCVCVSNVGLQVCEKALVLL